VILYAKDAETGLTGIATTLVQPMLVSVGIDSFPPGLTVRVDDEPVTAYQTIVSWQEHNLEVTAEDQPPYTFVSWSDGSTESSISIRLNYSEPAITAIFCAEDEGTCNEDSECCSGICFQSICVEERSPTTVPLTHLTSSSEPPKSADASSDSGNARDPDAIAITFFVVVGIAVFALGGIWFAWRVLLKSRTTQNPHPAPKDVLEEQAPKQCDEEAAVTQDNIVTNDDDASDVLSNGAKSKGATVITQDTTSTSEAQL
jgi:hypothetical protein